MPTSALRAFAASAALAASLPAFAADAPDGGRLAAEQGCLNCHGERAHGAPTFKGLGERALQRGDAVEAVTNHLLEEMREKDIHTHAFVSEARARAVLTWVAQGAK
jgi:mono/diheme cytochrome c family protein